MTNAMGYETHVNALSAILTRDILPMRDDAFGTSLERLEKHSPSTRLEVRFERALRSVWLAFQPIVDVAARRTHGYEALVRSEDASLPTPGALLGAAEKLGRLEDLGRRIRTLAARSLFSAPEGALLFVNLHPRDLLDPDLYDPAAPLSQMARRVVLEITESALLDDAKDMRARLVALRALGFRIALEDLGAGYAGFSSFGVIDPEVVKLDMSMIREVHLSSVRQHVIASITSICAEKGKHVIAKGVESQEEHATLRSLGCNLLQGIVVSRPGPFFMQARLDY